MAAPLVDPPVPIAHGAAVGRPRREPLPGPPRGLLLDMCNVLYDNTIWRRWVLQLLCRLGLYTNYRCFFRLWDRDYLDDVHCGRAQFRDAFGAFLRSAGLSSALIDEVQAACQARRRHLQASARPLPGVKETLMRLHDRGLVLGVIGNSERSASVHREWLGRFGIAGRFSTVVCSIDLGRAMPDPACYLAALGAMNLPARQVAFVGHDTAELAGAAALGMPTIALNFDPDSRADVYLDCFEDLLDVVRTRPPAAIAG